jgi:pyruvate dehydrogenase E1 component beta subunit
VFGEGVTDPAGTYGTTKDLHKEFGEHRVFDVPLAEGLITGMGLGMALVGLRPIVIHPRNDFLFLALDQLCNHAAKWRHMFGTNTPVPLVVRSVACRGWGSAAQHSQTLYSTVAHFPHINVLVPSTPYDAKGFLLWAALESEEPVLIVEHKWLWKLKGEVPEGKYFSRPDGPRVIKKGRDITLVGISYGTVEALLAAKKLAGQGIEAEVIDIRSIRPLKMERIIQSVKKTGKLVVVDMDHNFLGTGAEIITQLVETLPPLVLRTKPVRVGLPDIPIPASSESTYYASPDCIVRIVTNMMGSHLKKEVAGIK